jgi:hypothetical protein
MEYNLTLRRFRNLPFAVISASGVSVHSYRDS